MNIDKLIVKPAFCFINSSLTAATNRIQLLKLLTGGWSHHKALSFNSNIAYPAFTN